MPFIDCKISKKLSDEQKISLKSELGKGISTLNKPESYLMVGINDDYNLYFAGKPVESGAYVAISVMGKVNAEQSQRMTKVVCDILKVVANIDGDKVYVTYQGIDNWGWNGNNF